MTVKEMKEMVASIPDEYDDYQFIIRTIINMKEDEEHFHAYDEPIEMVYMDSATQEFFFARTPVKEDEFTKDLAKLVDVPPSEELN